MSTPGQASRMPDMGVVHVVDDEEPVREALASLLRSMGYDVLLYASGPEFLQTELPARPGCILLDIRLPRISGLDLQSSLSAAGIDIPVILMSAFGDIPMTVKGMKAGALDFLTKPFRDQDVLDAVALGIAADQKRREEALDLNLYVDRIATLTPREREVMGHVLQGQQNKQIAYALDIKVVTVKLHRAAVMRKLGARSMLELVRMHDSLKGLDPALDSPASMQPAKAKRAPVPHSRARA